MWNSSSYNLTSQHWVECGELKGRWLQLQKEFCEKENERWSLLLQLVLSQTAQSLHSTTGTGHAATHLSPPLGNSGPGHYRTLCWLCVLQNETAGGVGVRNRAESLAGFLCGDILIIRLVWGLGPDGGRFCKAWPDRLTTGVLYELNVLLYNVVEGCCQWK